MRIQIQEFKFQISFQIDFRFQIHFRFERRRAVMLDAAKIAVS
jgi:hypothetical protein